MKERPILFSGPMVRAVLDGSKTQTRRVVKPKYDWYCGDEGGEFWPFYQDYVTASPEPVPVSCPYGVPGDRLWVREAVSFSTPTIPLHKIPTEEQHALFPYIRCWYQADNDRPTWAETAWKPSIHMPRWASRIALEITGVRVERLNEISRGDAMGEGCPHSNMAAGPNPVDWYRDLWNSINGPGSWDANPFVWVIEFKRSNHAD